MPKEALRRRRQRFDNPAIRNRSAAALVNQGVQFCLERLQIPDFSLNFQPVFGRNCVDCRARAAAVVREREQLAHLLQRKT
jgi:hypothetical protein